MPELTISPQSGTKNTASGLEKLPQELVKSWSTQNIALGRQTIPAQYFDIVAQLFGSWPTCNTILENSIPYLTGYKILFE
jgi:hypothetical protein